MGRQFRIEECLRRGGRPTRTWPAIVVRPAAAARLRQSGGDLTALATGCGDKVTGPTSSDDAPTSTTSERGACAGPAMRTRSTPGGTAVSRNVPTASVLARA